MPTQNAPRFWLAICLVAGMGVHWAAAGEKIQFSTGNKGGKKDNLALQPNKPALPDLDFSKMGGRGSKAEELAPTTPPPTELAREENDPLQKKQDRDWLTNGKQDRDNKDGKDGKEGKSRDKNKDKNRNEKNQPGDRQEEENDRLDQKKVNDPFKRDERRDAFTRLNSDGSSTNKILFGESTRPENQIFRAERAPGAPPALGTGLPPGAGPHPMEEQSRVSTLERLGLAPAAANGGGIGPGQGINNGNLGLGAAQSGMRGVSNGQLDPIGRGMGPRDNGQGGLPGRDNVFRSGLINDAGGMNPAMGNNQSRAYEPPPSPRKPAILPVPQRKF